MKIICCVMHGKNCLNRYNNVMQTWGKDIDAVFFSDYQDENKKVFKTTDRENYFGLEDKLVNAIKLIYEKFPDYDWYLWCDDDTFVNTQKLNKEISTFDEDIVYGKMLIHYLPNQAVDFHSGGGGTLISKKVMQKLSISIKNYNLSIADVSLGLNLDDIGVKKEDSNYFISGKPQSFGIREIDYHEFITFHHISNFEEMNSIYKIIKTK